MDDNDGNSVAAGADDDLEEGERIIWEEAANGDIDTWTEFASTYDDAVVCIAELSFGFQNGAKR